MIAWAEAEFRRHRPMADGASAGDHETAAARQWRAMGRKPKPKPQAPTPDCRAALAYLWRWFIEILAGVSPNGMVMTAIGWRDLAAWCDMTGTPLHPWEARLLIDLSSRRFAILSEKKPTHGHSQ